MRIEPMVIALVALLVLVTIACIFWLGAPPVSSTDAEAQAVIELLTPLNPEAIADLGAGWGKLVSRLAHAFPLAQVTGYELSPVPWLIGSLRTLRLKNAHIKLADFRKASPKIAVAYLARAPMIEVAKMDPEVLVSVCFLLRDRTPVRVIHANRFGGDVALYIAEPRRSMPPPSGSSVIT